MLVVSSWDLGDLPSDQTLPESESGMFKLLSDSQAEDYSGVEDWPLCGWSCSTVYNWLNTHQAKKKDSLSLSGYGHHMGSTPCSKSSKAKQSFMGSTKTTCLLRPTSYLFPVPDNYIFLPTLVAGTEKIFPIAILSRLVYYLEKIWLRLKNSWPFVIRISDRIPNTVWPTFFALLLKRVFQSEPQSDKNSEILWRLLFLFHQPK